MHKLPLLCLRRQLGKSVCRCNSDGRMSCVALQLSTFKCDHFTGDNHGFSTDFNCFFILFLYFLFFCLIYTLKNLDCFLSDELQVELTGN